MATEIKRPTRTHVSGFVKGFHENCGHGVINFRVVEQKFVLPVISTFALEIIKARKNDWNVLVLFNDDGTFHPKVTGVIPRPKWRQHNAASNGESYETVKALK